MRNAVYAALALLCAIALMATVVRAEGSSSSEGWPARGTKSACPYKCQNGGVCTKGVCECPLGFVGADCARRGCASNCNSRGYCDLSSQPAQCLCFPGFTGLDCQDAVSTAPKLSDAAKTAMQKAAGAEATAATGNAPQSTNSSGSSPATADPKKAATPAAAVPKKPTKAETVKRLRKDRGLCTPECAKTGFCLNGACLCADGYTGPTCALKLCADDCNGHGMCDQRFGVCECFKPYTGRTCARTTKPIIPRRPDTMRDVWGGPIPEDEDTRTRLWTDKPGLSDTFHLIEEQAHALQRDAEPMLLGRDM